MGCSVFSKHHTDNVLVSNPTEDALLLCPQPTEEDEESRLLQAIVDVRTPRRERTPWKEKMNENIHVRMRLLKESQVLDTLRGRLHFEDVPSRNILVFISSTFTDTAAERNILLQDVFPYLDEYARKHGYYFQGSEMRWGIRKHASEDNMTAEICLSEMENCQESSGVNYVLLQTQKYGYQPLPKRIDQAVFQRMLECANSLESSSLSAHYVLDNNKLEPEYVLEIRSLSKDEWCKLEIELRRVLQDCSIRAWPDLDICDLACHHPAKNFFISVTEMEICKGLIQQPDRDQKCLVFSRTITDLAEMLSQADADRKMIGNYLDLLDGALKHEEQQRLRWCHENIPLICKKDPLNHWDVKWGPGVSEETHSLYLEEFADRFCMLMMNSIKQQIVAEERIDDYIYSEVQSHMEIVVNRAGRYVETEWGQKILAEVISYVKDSQSRFVIIQGASGSGKSSLMAKLCKEISQEYGPPPSPKSAIIISRFLGSTYSSSSARGLICSILEQIDRIQHLVNQKAHTSGDEHKCPVWKRKRVTKRMNNSDFPTKFDELARDFRNSLAQASSTYPLVLILDHVDQLCEDDDGALSCWLPTNLPSNVIIIISALEPDAGSVKCQFLSNFKSKIQDDALTVIHIPRTGQDDGNTMLENFLSKRGRLLSESQKSLLLESFKENSTPRWLEVASGLAMTFTSYMPFDRLNSTLSGMLLVSIEKFELTHGCQLVKSVSAYVALSRFGVSESELLQLLSLNDLVLADVYEWWVPPLRILPPMLLKRLLQDYQPYMRSRTKGGSSLLAFLDTVISDTLLAKYVTADKVKAVHHDLMHFFLGTWAGKMKPYQDVLKRKLRQFGLTESQGDRLAIPQPLILHSTAPFFCALSTTSSSTFHSYVNVRKVDELIYHCCRTGDEWYTKVLKRQDGIGFIGTYDKPLVQVDGDSGDNVPGDSEDSAKAVAGAGHAHEGGGGWGRVVEESGGDVHEGFAAETVAETGHPGREGGHGDGGPSSTVKIVLSQICCLQYFYAKCAAGRLRDLMREIKWLSSQDSMDEQNRHTVNDYSSFLALNSHAFGGNPELILQQALNLPAHMKPALEARELLAASCHDALLRPLEEKEVSIPVVCNLQHSSFKPAKDVSFIKGTSSYLCSLSSDSSLKVFDYRIGEEVCEIRHIDGRSPLLSAAVFHRHDAAHESKVSMEIDVSRADSICIIGGREDGSIIKWSGSATDMPELETSSSQLTASVRKVFPLSSTSHDSIFALTGMSEIYSVDIDTLEGSLFYKHDQQIVDCSISEDTSVFVIGDNYHVSSIISIKSQIIQQKRRHEYPVHAVAVTVPKKLCASGLKAKHSQMEGIEFFRGPIELWNISTGEQVAMLEGGTITGTYSLNFSNDGKYLVSVMSWCPTVWDCDTFQCIMTLPSSEPAVTAKFSPDCNNMIASCDSMGRDVNMHKILKNDQKHSIKVWTVESCGRRRHSGTVRHLVSCSPNGSLFVSAGADCSVRLFERDSEHKIHELCSFKGANESPETASAAHTSDVNRVSISSDLSTFVSSSDDKSVGVWKIDHTARKLNKVARLTAGGWLECVTLTACGDLIAAGDNFGVVKIWRYADSTWEEHETIATVADFVLPQEHRVHITHATCDNVGCINISFSTDNSTLVLGRGDGMIGVYKAQTGVRPGKFSGGLFASVVAHEIIRADGYCEVFAEVFSDSTTVLSVGDARLCVWDIQPKDTLEHITEYELSGAGRRFICGEDKLIVSTWNGWVDIFHSEQHSGESSSSLHWCRFGLVPLMKMWHGSRVDGFILSHILPNILVYGDDNGDIGVWEMVDASSTKRQK